MSPNIIANQSPHPYRLTRSKPAPVFGPYQARVEAGLAPENDHLPKKQHYTIHRIFEVIQAEGYQGSESPPSSICSSSQKGEPDARNVLATRI